MTWPSEPANETERREATLCHLSSIFFPYLVPIGFMIWNRGRSKFVAVNALQSLIEAIFLSIFVAILLVVSLTLTAIQVWQLIESRGQNFEWSMVWTAMIKSLVLWAGLGLVTLGYTIRSVLDAIRAYDGRWKPSILSGRLDAKVLKIDRSALPQ